LDPSLAHLNFEPLNIFPSAQEFLSYLDVHCVGTTTSWTEVAPGDVIDASSCSVIERGGHHVESEDYESYISQYMKSYEEFFASREGEGVMAADSDVLSMLERCLAAKLEAMPLRDRIGVPFIFLLTDIGAGVRVDFGAGTVEQVVGFRDESYYAISARSSEVAKVVTGAMTWDEFSLSFRMKLDRKPDVYNTLLQGFIRLEPEDLKALCDRIVGIEDAQERIEVSVGTRRYIVNRYCPHQGGDLARGWIEEDRFLTCPRHQWQFDLCDGGEARMNDGNIYAVPLDED
jgi:UDP-MurNAc hydroxylase